MKRVLVALLIGVLLLSMCGCANKKETAMEQTVSAFMEALRVYDREQMTELLSEFPDKTPYVYYDDIFNDTQYMEMYRILFADLTYSVVKVEDGRLAVSVTMPNVQKLYSDISAMVLNMALEDEALLTKLSENDENASILVREMMLAYAKNGYEMEQITEEFTLSFATKEGKSVLLCDDALRALMTGNFFLAKNDTQAEIHSAD